MSTWPGLAAATSGARSPVGSFCRISPLPEHKGRGVTIPSAGYPNQDFERWASQFNRTFLELLDAERGLLDDALDTNTCAIVAALLVVADRIDAVAQYLPDS